MKFIKQGLITINVLVVFATALAFLTSIVPPDKLWVFTYFGLFYPLLFFINCLFIMLWLFMDVKWIIPSLLTLLLGWNYTTGFIGIRGGGETTDSSIRVLTYNSHFFRSLSGDKDPNESIKRFFKSIDDIDLIALQELNYNKINLVMDIYDGYNLIVKKPIRNAIITKHKLIQQGNIDFGTLTNSCIWADIAIKEDTVRVYSIHLQSNNITSDANKVIKEMDLQEKKTWSGAKSILTKYLKTATERSDQASQIREHAETSPYPVIFLGDFNDPPSSYTYKLMSDNMRDAFREKGSGIGSTYGGKIPFLRIDYIMTDPRIRIMDYKTLEVAHSDHFPISASIEIGE